MKLESFLQARGVDFEKHSHTQTFTAQDLAHTEHVSGYMVAKPVVVKGDTDFAMCVLSAPRHLDLERAAKALNEPVVRLATEAEMAEFFVDCELGAEPPVGALFGLKTIMDEQLREDEYLVMQAGTHKESITLRREDWERVTEPVVAAIAAG